ncbi:Pyrroline-5-carboxylate reductase [bioreactor metagenome]|uniref:Pyrroline-5-carboxylate reductase n=1 Tax=bioreactor metagenome TaxID=1076179 RepID=A0A645FUC2_9ZZZZ
MLSAAQENSCPMSTTEHFIPGKDASLEASIATLQSKLEAIGFHIEERSWLNPVEGVWSVHIRDRDCPLLFTNGKGGSELAARSSESAEVLRQRVTSKGGTTYAAITHMQEQKLPEHFIEAMRKAQIRAQELAAEFGK